MIASPFKSQRTATMLRLAGVLAVLAAGYGCMSHPESAGAAAAPAPVDLSATVRKLADDELANLVRLYAPKAVYIFVSDAKTGKLLASAQQLDPANPNAVYEPGSLFKVVTFAAALDCGIVTPESMVDCALASVAWRGKILSLTRDAYDMGEVDFRQAVAQSSNRGASLLALRLDEARGQGALYDYARRFGFGKTDAEADGAPHGWLLPREQWSGINLVRQGIGHSLVTVPSECHRAMAVIAAGGLRLEPAKTAGAEMQQVQVVEKKTAKVMADLLRGVCSTGGVGAMAEIPGYAVGGQPSIVQKIINGHYSGTHHVTSFSGFFPAEDPRYVITVTIDEPVASDGKAVYGGRAAAESFRRIALGIIRETHMEPVR